LIVAGWAIVNYQNNKRETRKEIRASLLDLYTHLDAIEDAAIDYHTTDGSPAKARRIRRDIQQIAPRILMARRGQMKIDYKRAVFELRRAITLENFDTENYAPRPSDDPLLDEISRTKTNLIFALEGAYGRAYP
jgi:hypothetical protein